MERRYLTSQKAFTLIELVVVIVILGVLAVVAAPRFLNLQSDARIAVVDGVQAAMQNTSDLVAAKAILQSQDTLEDGSVVLESVGQTVATQFGFVEAHWNNGWRYILNIGQEIGFTPVRDVCTINALCGVGNQRANTVANISGGLPADIPTPADGRFVLIWPEGFTLSQQCFTYYYHPEVEGVDPVIGSVTTGC